MSGTPPGADLALIQGGFGYLTAAQKNAVAAVWIFSRGRTVTSLHQLQGLQVAVGPERSGSRKVTLTLFEQARIETDDINLSTSTGLEAVQALRQGTVDVVFMVSSRDSSVIQNMLGVPGLQLANLQKSAAIVERNPYLETSLLPQGALDARIPLT